MPASLEPIEALCRAYARDPSVRSVAVIGNKPLHPSRERATVVDSSDLVVRVNGFRADDSRGEPFVGRRTDVVFLHRGVQATPWLFDSYRDRLYLMVEPARFHGEPDWIPPWWPLDLGYLAIPNSLTVEAVCWEMGIDVRREPRWPTTGTLAAWIASKLFPEAELRLAGFSMLDDQEQLSWRHASGRVVPVRSEHLLDREALLMTRWIDEGRARLVR